jgi:hypothetical protein
MRVLIAITTSLVLTAGLAVAQTTPTENKQPGDAAQSTGRSPSDASKNEGQMQPQGPTGPLNTTSGGAPAESPQGQTPPGMQAAPQGSDKTIVDGEKK